GGVGNQLGGKNVLAMDSYQPTMGTDRMAGDSLASAPPATDAPATVPGLHAKQLSLEGIKGAHAPKPSSLAHTVKTGPQQHLPTKGTGHHGHDHGLTAHHPELSRASQFQKHTVEHPAVSKPVEAANTTPTDATTATTDATTQVGDAGATDATAGNYT